MDLVVLHTRSGSDPPFLRQGGGSGIVIVM